MSSTIPDCDWKPYEGDDLSVIRGEFKPGTLFKIKRILGMFFFCVFLPAFGLWYLYFQVIQAENSHIGVPVGLGLLVCFAAPFFIGKVLLQSKPVTYQFTDAGIAILGQGVVLEWEKITSIQEAKLGYHHQIRFSYPEGLFSMPVYASLLRAIHAPDSPGNN